MKAMQYSQKWLRQRKFLLVLPALVIPFVTMAFWALGGGKGASIEGHATAKNGGFNLQLPGIHFLTPLKRTSIPISVCQLPKRITARR